MRKNSLNNEREGERGGERENFVPADPFRIASARRKKKGENGEIENLKYLFFEYNFFNIFSIIFLQQSRLKVCLFIF